MPSWRPKDYGCIIPILLFIAYIFITSGHGVNLLCGVIGLVIVAWFVTNTIDSIYDLRDKQKAHPDDWWKISDEQWDLELLRERKRKIAERKQQRRSK